VIALLFQQYREIERAGGISSLNSSGESGHGAGTVAATLEQDSEIRRRRRVAESVGLLVRLCRADRITAFLEEESEVECAVGVTSLTRAAERATRRLDVSVPFEEHPEVAGCCGMASPVRFGVCLHRARVVAPLLERHSLVEEPLGVGGLRGVGPGTRRVRGWLRGVWVCRRRAGESVPAGKPDCRKSHSHTEGDEEHNESG
jgi:hypothetical protein